MKRNELEQVLSFLLEQGIDFAELFLEDRRTQELRWENQNPAGSQSVRLYGVGLRLIHRGEVIYTHSNDVSPDGLMKLAKRSLEFLQNRGEKRIISSQKTQLLRNPNQIQILPSAVELKRKWVVLKETDAAILGAGLPLMNHRLQYSDMEQQVQIANTEGVYAEEQRMVSRMRCYYTVGDSRKAQSDWCDFVKPVGFEVWESEEHQRYFIEQIKSTNTTLHAQPLKACVLPVVMEAGACGTLWHECCGHTLEAIAISEGRSDFIGKIGQKIASEKVTLIDDGTIPGLYGSSAYDDEGQPRRRNVLIENGVLKDYLCDRYHGEKIGRSSNGCGRRQDYTFAPTSRMSNTFLEAGHDDDEEIIRSLAEGLYVKRLGGGSGGQIFSLACSKAWMIKNGQLAYPVSRCMLTGNGLEVMQKVDRVGRTLKMEYGSFCGASSGLVGVTAFQPRVRISEMVIGGEA